MKDHLMPYLTFTREEWAKLRNSVPMLLTEKELKEVQGINEHLSMSQISDIYLPLSRLLSYGISSHYSRQKILSKFLGKPYKAPYIIGITGSVAVGKSTTARILQRLLARWPEYRKVDLVTTDGFLYPNDKLKKDQLMAKKGFPESYDLKQLLTFVSRVKSGESNVKAPIYSHQVYDILPNQEITVNQPDVLILEGLNILQSESGSINDKRPNFLPDFIDFSIYVDAPIPFLKKWYLERFLTLRESAFTDPNSYFHHYAQLTKSEALDISNQIWTSINEENLVRHILPTRNRANLILTKDSNHRIDKIQLRR